MKHFKYLPLVISLFIFISSCSSAFKFDGKKAPQVMITDLGEMYSTYNLSESEKTEIRKQVSSEALLDEIMRYSKEVMWPEAINTLDERLKVRATMMKYNFYKVASFGTKTIVSIPKEKNKHMPAGFIPDGPMFIIFASSVVAGK